MKSYSDKESRKLIVTDFNNTLFVEAGAGSGKTTSMVSRIMAIILKGLASVQEIVSITFTNEGAASLKLKILQELERANRADKYSLAENIEIQIGEKEKQLLSEAIRFLPLAQFSTIHSFCLAILKERPIEVGIDPEFNMESERDIVSSFDEYWNNFLIENSAGSGLLSKIISEEIDLEILKNIALIKCSNPNLQLFTEACSNIKEAQLDKVIARIRNIFDKYSDEIEKMLSDTGTGAGKKRVTEFNKLKNLLDSANDHQTKKQFVLKVYVPNDMPKKYDSVLNAYNQIRELVGECSKKILDYKHSIIVPLIEEFQNYFIDSKKKNSKLDFDDLLSLTADLMQNNLEVRKYFKNKYKYIFVDETQDTDPLQTETMFFLAERHDKNSSGWQDVELEPSKLFMVGDPKQSIYKFRKADVQIYEKTKKIIASQNGKILELSRNFRSHKSIINFVNTQFEKSFEKFKVDQENGLQAKYIPLEFSALKTAKSENNLYSIFANGTKKQEIISSEISKIISFIKKIVGNNNFRIYCNDIENYRDIKYSDIMILYRGLPYIDDYTIAFEQYDIPHQVIGGKTFFNTEDVKGLVYALKVIDDPSDSLSLFAALRSPVFGISDKAMYEFVSSGKKLMLFANTKNEVSDISKLLEQLRLIFILKTTNRPSVILKKIYDLSGICHLALIEPNGHQKTARYYRLLELLLEIEEDQTLSFSAVVGKLEDVMNSDDPRMSNLSLSQSGSDAVKLITIHKSKGLESPVIILAGSQFDGSNGGANCYVLREKGQIVIPYGDGGYYSLNREELEQLEVRKSVCEDERLRYVAATRARDILSICTSDKGSFNLDFQETLKTSENVQEVSSISDEEKIGKPDDGKIDAENMFRSILEEQKKSYAILSKNAASINSLIYSVHDLMDYDKSIFSEGGRDKKGKNFGNLIHRMMENYINGNFENPNSVIDTWIEEEGVSRSLKTSVLRMFSEMIKNKYVIDAKKSHEKYCEWEFFCKDRDKIVNGIIDVVYKNLENEWVILDFKTDDISDPDYKSKVDDIYQKQLSIYKKYFEILTQEKVKECYIIYDKPAK